MKRRDTILVSTETSMLRAEQRGDSGCLLLSQEGGPEEVSEWQGLCLALGPSCRLSIFISDMGEGLERNLI